MSKIEWLGQLRVRTFLLQPTVLLSRPVRLAPVTLGESYAFSAIFSLARPASGVSRIAALSRGNMVGTAVQARARAAAIFRELLTSNGELTPAAKAEIRAGNPDFFEFGDPRSFLVTTDGAWRKSATVNVRNLSTGVIERVALTRDMLV